MFLICTYTMPPLVSAVWCHHILLAKVDCSDVPTEVFSFFSVKLMFKKNKNQHKPAGSGPFKKTFVLVTLARNKQQTLHRLHRKRVLLQSTEITIIDRVIPAKRTQTRAVAQTLTYRQFMFVMCA